MTAAFEGETVFGNTEKIQTSFMNAPYYLSTDVRNIPLYFVEIYRNCLHVTQTFRVKKKKEIL